MILGNEMAISIRNRNTVHLFFVDATVPIFHQVIQKNTGL